jgi:hypothetical protein
MCVYVRVGWGFAKTENLEMVLSEETEVRLHHWVNFMVQMKSLYVFTHLKSPQGADSSNKN